MHKRFKILFLFSIISTLVFAQFAEYNHPELKWITFETEHFLVHYHNGTEWTAKEAAKVAETVYPTITEFYDFEPTDKTDLIIRDTDDIANGAAYYFDNKIDIWASPLDFELRGAHRWLRNVITHEFAHIVSLQKAMKAPRNFPAFFFQAMAYEPEKREDVVRGYPNVIILYPFPTMIMPMWLAEGVAQYQYPGSTNDYWDSHRDMIIRDRIFHDNLFSFKAMESFGKPGIGSESVYNQGYGLTKFIAENYGENVLPEIIEELSNPFQYNINKVIKKVIGKSGEEVYCEWKSFLTKKYYGKTENIRQNLQLGNVILEDGISQLHPNWGLDENVIYYLSSKGYDYFSLTSLYKYDLVTEEQTKIKSMVNAKAINSKHSKIIYYSRKSKPNKIGSVFNNIYKYDLLLEKEAQITFDRRGKNPVLSNDNKNLYFIHGSDGKVQIVKMEMESREEKIIADFDNGIQLHNLSLSADGNRLAFDITSNHGRDINYIDLDDIEINSYLVGNYDERDPCYSKDGKWLYYSSDQTGIFNIYRKSLETDEIQQITNVPGGAFMPSVNSKNQLVYSLFENSKYKIALLKDITPVLAENAVYLEQYAVQNFPMMDIKDLGDVEETRLFFLY